MADLYPVYMDIGGVRTKCTAYMDIDGVRTLISSAKEAVAAIVLDLWSGGSINCVTYTNGYWVVGGNYYDGSTYYARIAYAKNPSDTWTTVDLWSDNVKPKIYQVIYENGYWVVVGVNSHKVSMFSTKGYARIAYTTSIDGEWVVNDLWSSNGSNSIQYIAWANGSWVVAGIYWVSSTGGAVSYNARVATATTLDGTWTTQDLWVGNYATYVKDLIYTDGYWVVVGSSYNGNSYDANARIAYVQNPSDTWTVKSLWSYNGTTAAAIDCITRVNGYWVVGGKHGDDSDIKYARIAYTENLSGTWTTKDLWSGSDTANEIMSIKYADGHWTVGGRSGGKMDDGNYLYYAKVATSTTLDGTWTVQDLWGANSNTYNAIGSVIYENGYWVATGTYHDGSTHYARIAYTKNPSDTWTTKDLWSRNADTTKYGVDILYIDGYWFACGDYYDGSTTYARIAANSSIERLGET